MFTLLERKDDNYIMSKRFITMHNIHIINNCFVMFQSILLKIIEGPLLLIITLMHFMCNVF